jgi:hypothetical protein
VLEEDRPYVEAWNGLWERRLDDGFATEEQFEQHRLRVSDRLPEPATGPRDAMLVILDRNPWWTADDDGYATAELIKAKKRQPR